MATDAAMLSIGAVARRVGISVQAVRYYERIGLLPRAARATSGYRKYAEDAVTRLRFIRRAAELGFTLAETRELLALRSRAGAPCTAVRSRAESKLRTIERKLAELVELRDAVAALVHACAGDVAVERCSILAALGGRAGETASDTTNRERTGSWQRQRQQPLVAPRRASPARKRVSGASKTA